VKAATRRHHDHHELPTSGDALNAVAFSATLHCLTGCAIGEVLGMIIGTALGFSDWGTIALAVALAFLFGYSLTSLPLLRAGLAFAAVVPIALATDTVSIAVMEIVDNAILLAIPGAMEAGVGDLLFWGALSVALVVAGVVAFPVNRWLITRGKGHAVLHESGHHPNFPTRLVAVIATAAAIFGTTVLIAEALSSEGDETSHPGVTVDTPAAGQAADQPGRRSQPDPVGGPRYANPAAGRTPPTLLTKLSGDARGPYPAVPVPLGPSVTQPHPVHHAVAEEPVIGGGIDLADRVRADSQIAAVEVLGYPSGHRKLGQRHFFGHRGEFAAEVGIHGRGGGGHGVSWSDVRCGHNGVMR
jgi:hypothetical protein